MSDTQWPTFAVFHQVMEDKPHIHAGSVHAPDPELALMNARDVFVRRPPCVSLWVAPTAEIFTWTQEQLGDPRWAESGEPIPDQHERFVLMKKSQPAGACTYLAEVDARSAVEALKIILEKEKTTDGLLWWVIPARLIMKSTPEDIESMFEPAETKPFRHQSDFHTLTKMRQLAAGGPRQSTDET